VELTVSVAEPDITIVVGASVITRLDEAAYVRLTVPLKPPIPFTVIVLEAAVPATMLRLVGLAVIVKSDTLTVTVAECERLLLVPVMDGLVPVTVTV
jgi:hypothetical protein